MRYGRAFGVGLILGMVLVAIGIDLRAQLMQLDDGTVGTKVVLFSQAGVEQSVGGGTQYAEDSAHSSGDTLTMAGVVQVAACGTGLAGNGDRTLLQVNADGELCSTAGGSGGEVTNAGTFAVQVDGDALTALQLIDNLVLAEDGAHSSGEAGLLPLGVRNDALTALAADGDRIPFMMNADGELAIADATSRTSIAAAVTALQLIDNAANQTPSDNFANPSGALVTYSLMGCWDGATWDRCPSGSGNIGAPDANTTRAVEAALPAPFRSIDLDETEEEADGSPTEVCGVWFTNTATSTRWLKFYNATAANTTVGTTTPVITIGLPGNSSDDISGQLGIGSGGCVAFDTALSLAATTGVADNDTGAPGANEVIVTVFRR